MTTLSKEDVKGIAESLGWSLDEIEIGDMVDFAALARADLVAENERLKEGLRQVTISKDCYFEERNSARAAFHRRVKEVESLQSELTATRTALAAAEAREGKLRAAIDVVLSDAEECEDHDGWLANLVSCEAIHQLDEAFSQPRDYSALREMIAGVYEECASWYADRGCLLDESDVPAAIRALAEKAKGE